MSVKKFKDILKALPTLTDASGMLIQVFDSNGNSSKVSIATLSSAIAATGKMMRVEIIASNTPLNANNLTQSNTIYTPEADLSLWNQNVEWLNFPTSRPVGGFSLMNIKEGLYIRQYFTTYSDPATYTRFTYYGSTQKVFSAWQKVTPASISS